MAKKEIAEHIVKIKKSLETGNVLGQKAVKKSLIKDELKEIFMASNIPEYYESEITKLAEINKVPISKIEQANDELGTLCKKPFSISIIGLKK